MNEYPFYGLAKPIFDDKEIGYIETDYLDLFDWRLSLGV